MAGVPGPRHEIEVIGLGGIEGRFERRNPRVRTGQEASRCGCTCCTGPCWSGRICRSCRGTDSGAARRKQPWDRTGEACSGAAGSQRRRRSKNGRSSGIAVSFSTMEAMVTTLWTSVLLRLGQAAPLAAEFAVITAKLDGCCSERGAIRGWDRIAFQRARADRDQAESFAGRWRPLGNPPA